MWNYLKMIYIQRIQALLELGWSYRRIERETGVRRETTYFRPGDRQAAASLDLPDDAILLPS